MHMADELAREQVRDAGRSRARRVPLAERPATVRTAGRLASVLFVGSGLVTLATVPLPGPRDENDVGLAMTALVAVAVGVATWAMPWHRWDRRASLVLPVVGLVLIAGLILKEKKVPKIVARFAITMIVFMAVTWFVGFVIDAMYKPLFEILDKIG